MPPAAPEISADFISRPFQVLRTHPCTPRPVEHRGRRAAPDWHRGRSSHTPPRQHRRPSPARALVRVLRPVDELAVTTQPFGHLVPSDGPCWTPIVAPSNRNRCLGSSIVQEPSACTTVVIFSPLAHRGLHLHEGEAGGAIARHADHLTLGVCEFGADRLRDPGSQHPKFIGLEIGARGRRGQEPRRPHRGVAAVDRVDRVAAEHIADLLDRVRRVDAGAVPVSIPLASPGPDSRAPHPGSARGRCPWPHGARGLSSRRRGVG